MTNILKLAVCNQTIPLYTNNEEWRITVRTFSGQVFVSVRINGEDVVVSRRVAEKEWILPHSYQVRDNRGNLRFESLYDNAINDVQTWGSGILLCYYPANEINAE